MPPRILFVHQQTLGLRHDAVVLAKALRMALSSPEIFSLEVPGRAITSHDLSLEMPNSLRSLLPFDAVFFFEHLYANYPFTAPFFCRRRIYIPNVEWITSSDEEAIATFPMDAVFYKNAFTANIVETLGTAHRVPLRIITGWTSVDLATRQPRCGTASDFTTFLHVRGVSVQKQTNAVIQAWLENPDFPQLTVVATMRDGFEVPVALRATPNLEIVCRRLSTQELRELQKKQGVHICPSEAEGFGHSLNEARSCAAVLITTDGPPMHDFVIPGVTGMLVEVFNHNIGTFNRSKAFRVTPESLARTVRDVLNMTVEDRIAMGLGARRQYLLDKSSFEANIIRLFSVGGALAIT